jgi:hypothetical protein
VVLEQEVNVLGPFDQFSELQNQTEQARLDFIKTELDLCATFAAIVETEYSLGNREHAYRTMAEAEKAHSEALRAFSQATGLTPKAEQELQRRFKHLRDRLDGLQRLLMLSFDGPR